MLLFWPALIAQQAVGQDTTRVLIVYYSEQGHTAAMAQAVASGVRAVPNVVVKILPLAAARNADVLAADAIILGSPVYNANIAPSLQQFINQWPFEGNPLRDKVGAVFVTAGGMSAGEELAQMGILQSMLIFGMIVVGGPDWRAPFGASAIVNEGPFDTEKTAGKVEAHFLTKGEGLGRRVAEAARRWNHGKRNGSAKK